MLGDVKIENNLSRLALIYNKVMYLRNNLFYVQEDKDSKIIDENGENVKILSGETIKFERCGYGWARTHKSFSTEGKIDIIRITNNNDIVEIPSVSKYVHLSDNVCAIEFTREYYLAIYGKQFDKITPNIYSNVYLDRESVNHINVRVRRERYGYGTNGYSVIRVNKEGDGVSHLFTTNIGMQENYQAIALKKDRNGKYRYALGVQGTRLTDRTFTSLTCSNRSIDRGLIEVWEEGHLYNYKGLITTGGEILIDTDKYGNIEETPFRDLFIVRSAEYRGRSEKVKIGIYQLGKGEVIQCGTFSDIKLIALNIIALNHTSTGKQVYLGNDRNIYADINKAFQMFRLKKAENIYMINVYGVWSIIDKDFVTLALDLEKMGVKSDDWVRV